MNMNSNITNNNECNIPNVALSTEFVPSNPRKSVKELIWAQTIEQPRNTTLCALIPK